MIYSRAVGIANEQAYPGAATAFSRRLRTASSSTTAKERRNFKTARRRPISSDLLVRDSSFEFPAPGGRRQPRRS